MCIKMTILKTETLFSETRANKAHRDGRAFLHHITQLAGHNQMTAPRHKSRLGKQNLSADGSPCHSRDNTRRFCFAGLIVMSFFMSEIFFQLFGVHMNFLGFSRNDFFRGHSGKLGQFSGQPPYAGFRRIILDNFHHGFMRNGELLFG